MKDVGSELVAEILSGLGAVLFTAVGVVIEYAAVINVVSGELTLGAWELLMGGLAIFVGLYLIGYREFWRRMEARLSA